MNKVVNPKKVYIIRLGFYYHIAYFGKDCIFIHKSGVLNLKMLLSLQKIFRQRRIINFKDWFEYDGEIPLHYQYLIKRTHKKRRAHIWTGDDSLCRMFSTSDMCIGKTIYELHDSTQGVPVCALCQQKYEKMITRINHSYTY